MLDFHKIEVVEEVGHLYIQYSAWNLQYSSIQKMWNHHFHKIQLFLDHIVLFLQWYLHSLPTFYKNNVISKDSSMDLNYWIHNLTLLGPSIRSKCSQRASEEASLSLPVPIMYYPRAQSAKSVGIWKHFLLHCVHFLRVYLVI